MKSQASSIESSITIGIIIVLAGCSTIVTLSILNVFFDYPDYFVVIAFLIIPIMFGLFAISIFYFDNLQNYLKKWGEFNKSIDSIGRKIK